MLRSASVVCGEVAAVWSVAMWCVWEVVAVWFVATWCVWEVVAVWSVATWCVGEWRRFGSLLRGAGEVVTVKSRHCLAEIVLGEKK